MQPVRRCGLTVRPAPVIKPTSLVETKASLEKLELSPQRTVMAATASSKQTSWTYCIVSGNSTVITIQSRQRETTKESDKEEQQHLLLDLIKSKCQGGFISTTDIDRIRQNFDVIYEQSPAFIDQHPYHPRYHFRGLCAVDSCIEKCCVASPRAKEIYRLRRLSPKPKSDKPSSSCVAMDTSDESPIHCGAAPAKSTFQTYIEPTTKLTAYAEGSELEVDITTIGAIALFNDQSAPKNRFILTPEQLIQGYVLVGPYRKDYRAGGGGDLFMVQHKDRLSLKYERISQDGVSEPAGRCVLIMDPRHHMHLESLDHDKFSVVVLAEHKRSDSERSLALGDEHYYCSTNGIEINGKPVVQLIPKDGWPIGQLRALQDYEVEYQNLFGYAVPGGAKYHARFSDGSDGKSLGFVSPLDDDSAIYAKLLAVLAQHSGKLFDATKLAQYVFGAKVSDSLYIEVRRGEGEPAVPP